MPFESGLYGSKAESPQPSLWRRFSDWLEVRRLRRSSAAVEAALVRERLRVNVHEHGGLVNLRARGDINVTTSTVHHVHHHYHHYDHREPFDERGEFSATGSLGVPKISAEPSAETSTTNPVEKGPETPTSE